MNSREHILSKIKATREQRNQIVQEVNKPITSGLKQQDGELEQLFKSQIEAVNGECFILNSSEDIHTEVTLFLERNDALNKTFINTAALALFPDLKKYNTCEIHDVQIGISTCELLVAQTGTVIVSATEGRQILGLSPIHIIIARKTQLRATLEIGINELSDKYGSHFPSQLTLVTGPSRTADIEKTLILGAHGPKRLIVMIY